MRKLAGLVLALSILAAVPAWAADCKLQMASQIDLIPSPDYLLVPVQFGDAAKTMSLQLGLAQNAMPQSVVDELKISTSAIANPNLTVNYNGERIRRLSYPSTMSLGGIPLKKIEFLVTSKPMVDGTAGELGTSIFTNVDFELDPAHHKFNLFLTDHCPGQVIYWTNSPAARIPFARDDLGFVNLSMTLDGQPVRARLASEGRAHIGMNAMRHIFHIDENSPGVKLLDIVGPGDTKYYSYDFKSLAGDGLAILNPNIILVGEQPRPQCQSQSKETRTSIPGLDVHSILLADQCYGAYDVQLSASLLSKLRLYFASKEGVVYATAANAQ